MSRNKNLATLAANLIQQSTFLSSSGLYMKLNDQDCHVFLKSETLSAAELIRATAQTLLDMIDEPVEGTKEESP